MQPCADRHHADSLLLHSRFLAELSWFACMSALPYRLLPFMPLATLSIYWVGGAAGCCEGDARLLLTLTSLPLSTWTLAYVPTTPPALWRPRRALESSRDRMTHERGIASKSILNCRAELARGTCLRHSPLACLAASEPHHPPPSATLRWLLTLRRGALSCPTTTSLHLLYRLLLRLPAIPAICSLAISLPL